MSRTTREYGLETHAHLRSQQKAGEICGLGARGPSAKGSADSTRWTGYTALVLTVVAAALRFAVARSNLMDFGGIPYSRLLFGYKGYFGTAQFFSPLYQISARDIEHAIFFDRLAGTLTIPLIYYLCRRLAPGARLFPAIAAFLFAVYPLHILFSASDALAVFSVFLAAASYSLLVGIPFEGGRLVTGIRLLGGLAGLALLTQVRYENVLFLIPPALFLFLYHKALPRPELVFSLIVLSIFGAVYAYEGLTSGFSFRNPINLQRGFALTIGDLILNPFLALPVLFIATAVIRVSGRRWLGTLAFLPWIAALLLCVFTAEDGHGAARIFANWLVLILPLAAYGVSLLCGARLLPVRALGIAALVYFAALPFATHDRLAARHLEILENDRFVALLKNLPPGVERIIVPDDEMMWRRHHSTFEVYRKYEAILWPRTQESRPVRLIPLTRYLESEDDPCPPGRCLFFFGLPCMEDLMFPEARQQCARLLDTHKTVVLDETTVVAGPFVSCSIYEGSLARELCDPVTIPRRFVTYRIED